MLGKDFSHVRGEKGSVFTPVSEMKFLVPYPIRNSGTPLWSTSIPLSPSPWIPVRFWCQTGLWLLLLLPAPAPEISHGSFTPKCNPEGIPGSEHPKLAQRGRDNKINEAAAAVPGREQELDFLGAGSSLTEPSTSSPALAASQQKIPQTQTPILIFPPLMPQLRGFLEVSPWQ